jgi:hypothetical protein
VEKRFKHLTWRKKGISFSPTTTIMREPRSAFLSSLMRAPYLCYSNGLVFCVCVCACTFSDLFGKSSLAYFKLAGNDI